MRYTVRLENISETDRLVVKLILSLSERTKGRPCGYVVEESESVDKVDIVLRGVGSSNSNEITPASNMIILDPDGGNSQLEGYVISKPLIATRVLRVLDNYIKENRENAESEVVNNELKESQFQNEDNTEQQNDVDFCITEEEASELAIVDDESLSNPSNNLVVGETSITILQKLDDSESPRQKTASLVRLHPDKHNKEDDAVLIDSNSELSEYKPRALVVDDSPSVRKQIELELDLFYVDVDYAENVTDALALAREHQYNIAFLDVVLPDGDGFQICKTMKHEIKDINIIMLTGKASPADKIKGTMVGCDAYLVKPVGRMTFQNTVCRYLQLREQLDAVHG